MDRGGTDCDQVRCIRAGRDHVAIAGAHPGAMSDEITALFVLLGAPVVLGALFWLIVVLERDNSVGADHTPFDPPPRRSHPASRSRQGAGGPGARTSDR